MEAAALVNVDHRVLAQRHALLDTFFEAAARRSGLLRGFLDAGAARLELSCSKPGREDNDDGMDTGDRARSH